MKYGLTSVALFGISAAALYGCALLGLSFQVSAVSTGMLLALGAVALVIGAQYSRPSEHIKLALYVIAALCTTLAVALVVQGLSIIVSSTDRYSHPTMLFFTFILTLIIIISLRVVEKRAAEASGREFNRDRFSMNMLGLLLIQMMAGVAYWRMETGWSTDHLVRSVLMPSSWVGGAFGMAIVIAAVMSLREWRRTRQTRSPARRKSIFLSGLDTLFLIEEDRKTINRSMGRGAL